MRTDIGYLRALAASLILTACLASLAQVDPKAPAIRQLEEAYPGVRYTEGSPNDWRIAGGEFGGGASARDAAQTFVATYSDSIFHVTADDLVYAGEQDIMNGKFTAVYYDQIYNGLPVDNRYSTVLVKNTFGNPIVLVSGTLAGTPSNMSPTVFSSLGAAMKAVNYSRIPVKIESITHAIYTGTELPTNAYKVVLDNHILAWRYKHAIWVDATSGAIIGDKNLVYETDITGTLQGYATPGVLPDEASNPPVLMVLPEARVTDGDGHFAFTNLDGTFTIAHPGTASIGVTGSVVNGKYVTVTNNAAGGNESETVTIVPPGPANILLNPAKAATVTSQVNALVCGTNIHDFVKSVIPTYPGIDVPININVNVAQTCNANYDGVNLNFFAAGGGCVNTAYSTVIYHEYGHFVIDKGWSGAAGGYHEGIADTNASFYTNDPVTGRDFSGPGTFVRNSNTATEQYPSVASDVHLQGQVIAGAYWKAKRDLAALIGDTDALNVMRPMYLNDNLLHPPSVSPQILVDVLTMDDDDGNLANGTPHAQGIITGFAAHNLRVPGIPALKFDVTLPPGFETPGVAQTATLNVSAGNAAPNMSTVKLWTKLGAGSWTSTPLGSSNPISVPFAAQAAGTVLRWYISCDSATGTYTSFWPDAGQYDPQLTVYSYSPQAILYDDFETDKGWTVANTALSTGAWERGIPIATINDSTGEVVQPGSGNILDGGKKCYITQIGTAGMSYSQYDVDGGPTVLTSPTFDLAGANGVISFWTWLYCSTGEDVLTAEISNDGGTSWTTMRNFATGDYMPLTGNKYRQWLKTEFVAGDYVTPTNSMKVRFSVKDNPNNSVTEAGLDTVKVVKFSTTPTVVTFNGHVDLDRFVGSPAIVTLHVQFRDPVTHNVVTSADLQPDASGNFSVPNINVGTYDIAVKGDRWLRVINAGVFVGGSGTTNFTLVPNGDATGDNSVNLLDLSVVLANFGSTSPIVADLNGSGSVDLLDLSIILTTFGQSGPG